MQPKNYWLTNNVQLRCSINYYVHEINFIGTKYIFAIKIQDFHHT